MKGGSSVNSIEGRESIVRYEMRRKVVHLLKLNTDVGNDVQYFPPCPHDLIEQPPRTTKNPPVWPSSRPVGWEPLLNRYAESHFP